MSGDELLRTLDELDAAHKAATGGEWVYSERGEVVQYFAGAGYGWGNIAGAMPNDGKAIAALHNRWPAVSAAVRELIAERDREDAEPYVIRISRREMMELPLDVRRAVMERQTTEFIAANPDYGEALSETDAPDMPQSSTSAERIERAVRRCRKRCFRRR